MSEPEAIDRQIPVDAAPVQVAAALARSPWRDALRVVPAGSGCRIVVSASIAPRGLAREVERLVVDDLGRLRQLARPGTATRTAGVNTTMAPETKPTRRRTTKGNETMSEVQRSIVIDATGPEVWAVLADFGNVSVWNPSVKTSHLTSVASEGSGISRQCRLRPMGTVQERVVRWEPDRLLDIEIYENEGIPGFRSARATLILEAEGTSSTRVTVEMRYVVGFGKVGAAANAMGMRRLFTRSVSQLLAGLKYHVETGRPVDGDASLELDAVIG